MVSPNVGLPRVYSISFCFLTRIYILFLYLNLIIIINVSKSHDLTLLFQILLDNF